MNGQTKQRQTPLPKYWNRSIKTAVLHVISLAHYSIASARGWAANSRNARVRLAADVSQLKEEVAQLRVEIRIKNARMACIAPHRRPHYPPVERMAILELKAARGWSLSQAAEKFQIAAHTISTWLCRADEEGPNALVQTPEPANKFPDFVRYAVQRLKTLCPALGKRKIAESLARAGLHLGATTVGRLLKDKTPSKPLNRNKEDAAAEGRTVTAKRPNHVWHVDLTTVPILSGFWTAWLPFSLPQCWPFCYWAAIVEDHFSRRIMGVASFTKQPSALDVRAFLNRTIRQSEAKPKHLICDKGSQFWNAGFKRWCRTNGVNPRFGAVGRHGSIAVLERLNLTVKCLAALLTVIPLRREEFQGELRAIAEWYNRHRPHSSRKGKTPDEVYYGLFPANRRPRFEPRSAWPRGSPCSRPQALVKGTSGVQLELDVSFYEGRKHLPVIKVRRAA